MSGDGLKFIREAEKKAEGMVQDAKTQVNDILEEAQANARKIVLQAQETSQSKFNSILDETRRAAEEEASKIRVEGNEEIENAERLAKEKISAAKNQIIKVILP